MITLNPLLNQELRIECTVCDSENTEVCFKGSHPSWYPGMGGKPEHIAVCRDCYTAFRVDKPMDENREKGYFEFDNDRSCISGSETTFFKIRTRNFGFKKKPEVSLVEVHFPFSTLDLKVAGLAICSSLMDIVFDRSNPPKYLQNLPMIDCTFLQCAVFTLLIVMAQASLIC